MSKAKTSSPRLMAIRAVSEVLDEGLSLAESPSLQATSKDRDLSMARHLAYGVLRWLTALEWLANDLLSRPIRQRDRDIHRLILLGLYQLWQDETPPHAAIHETAECARHMGKAWAVGLVNAVLRRFDRERKASLDRLSLQEECFAHPLWMLHRFQHDWPDNWREVAQANNRQAPLWLRLNRVAPDLESVTERLEDQGFEVHAHASAPEALRISPAVPVENLESFSFRSRIRRHNWLPGWCIQSPGCGFWTPAPLPAEKPAICWKTVPGSNSRQSTSVRAGSTWSGKICSA